MIWVTWFTVVLFSSIPPGPGYGPGTSSETITLSEAYWNLEACEARIPAMIRIVEGLTPSIASLVDGAACVATQE